MVESQDLELALGKLRAAKAAMYQVESIQKIATARDQVCARYSPAFQPGAIETLSEDVLRSFLYIENNHHWSGLNRQVNRITADMEATRLALSELVDETRPIAERMYAATKITGMGKGIITAILHVAYPAKYGVWNSTSEGGLYELGLFPDWKRGASFGERYEAVNDVLLTLAQKLEVDLWTLDTIWWFLHRTDDDHPAFDYNNTEIENLDSVSAGTPIPQTAKFALERHLHNFMFDNWESLDLGKDWKIYSRDGEPDAGYEFQTPVGRIDLLARHKTKAKWLVVELKRDKSNDRAVGQLMRYMGWVKHHLAENSEEIEGLIVAADGDSELHYALEMIPSISFRQYEVDFRLIDAPSFQEFAKP